MPSTSRFSPLGQALYGAAQMAPAAPAPVAPPEEPNGQALTLLQALQQAPAKQDMLNQQLSLSQALLQHQQERRTSAGGGAGTAIGHIGATLGGALSQALGQQQHRSNQNQAQQARDSYNQQFAALKPGDTAGQRRVGMLGIATGDPTVGRLGGALVQDAQFSDEQGVKALAAGAKGADDLQKFGMDLRKEFLAVPSVRTAQEAMVGLSALRSNLAANTAAGDIAGVFQFMKALDPNSSVKSDEYANARNATGIPEVIRNQWNQLLSGKILGAEQRADFVARAQEAVAARTKPAQKLYEDYSIYAKNAGLEPSQVLPDLGFNATPAKPTQSRGGFAPGTILNTSDGKKFRVLPDGVNTEPVP